MGKVISLVNQKGGVGKTTSSINLSASLGVLGKKVLLIDLDSQGNATIGVGINRADIKYSSYDVLTNKCEIEDSIIKTKFKNLSLIPASLNLAGVEFEFMEMRLSDTEFNMGDQLKIQLDKIRDKYDYIIIDCLPSLGILTRNALSASNSVIIPIQCEYYALEGVAQLLNTVLRIQSNINPTLDIEGVLLTMLDARTTIGYEIVEDVRKFFKEKVFNTIIPRLVKLVEAPSYGKPICYYDSKSRGAEAYMNLAKEVIERNGKQEVR